MGDYKHVMAVNLRAPFLLGRELGPPMAPGVESDRQHLKHRQPTGGLADSSVHLVAKAGLVALTRNSPATSDPRRYGQGHHAEGDPHPDGRRYL